MLYFSISQHYTIIDFTEHHITQQLFTVIYNTVLHMTTLHYVTPGYIKLYTQQHTIIYSSTSHQVLNYTTSILYITEHHIIQHYVVPYDITLYNTTVYYNTQLLINY